MSFRKGDMVSILNRPSKGVNTDGSITDRNLIGPNVYNYTILTANGPQEALSTELRMVAAARPKILEGATIRLGYSLTACTIIAASVPGTSITLKRDRAVETTALGESDDAARTWAYENDPDGEEVNARRHSDGNWYVCKSEAQVTIGVRETANPVASFNVLVPAPPAVV